MCATDPGDGPEAKHESTEIDRLLMAESQQFKTIARAFERELKTLIKGTDAEKNIAAKFSAEAIKWHRLALEQADKVSARDHDRELVAHEREMSGLRASH
jgi:hypothetical protein